MLSFMNLNEFGDNFRKTKCKSGRATLVSISQTAKILFKIYKKRIKLKLTVDLWFLSLNGALYIVRIFHSILYGKQMNDDEGRTART